MNRRFIIPIAAAVIALTGMSSYATGGRPSVPKESETVTCYVEGERECPAMQGTERAAWDTWDRAGGVSKLRVDPSRPFRVAYVGNATTYPSLKEYDLAIPGVDGKWYVFRAEYTG